MLSSRLQNIQGLEGQLRSVLVVKSSVEDALAAAKALPLCIPYVANGCDENICALLKNALVQLYLKSDSPRCSSSCYSYVCNVIAARIPIKSVVPLGPCPTFAHTEADGVNSIATVKGVRNFSEASHLSFKGSVLWANGEQLSDLRMQLMIYETRFGLVPNKAVNRACVAALIHRSQEPLF